jgi:hypothetical protein
VRDRVDVRRVGGERAAGDQPGLAVRVLAAAQELHARLQDEVAADAPPREVQLVAGPPHVHAAGRERVFLGGRVPHGCAREVRLSNVLGVLELAERQERRVLRGETPDRGDRGCEDEHDGCGPNGR